MRLPPGGSEPPSSWCLAVADVGPPQEKEKKFAERPASPSAWSCGIAKVYSPLRWAIIDVDDAAAFGL